MSDVVTRSEEHTSELQSRVSTLFPYTTLFRSIMVTHDEALVDALGARRVMFEEAKA